MFVSTPTSSLGSGDSTRHQTPASRPSSRRLEIAAQAMFEEDFRGRLLPFGHDAAGKYAEIAVERRRVGRPIDPFDAEIGAITSAVGAALVTRNVADFVACGVPLVDPWA